MWCRALVGEEVGSFNFCGLLGKLVLTVFIALEKQLEKEGVDISKQPTDWFNLVWADNGDAISKVYPPPLGISYFYLANI